MILARKEHGPLFEEAQIVKWTQQLASGLKHLHTDANLIHQDLHNRNVLIVGIRPDREGLSKDVRDNKLLSASRVKIIDLGLSSFKTEHTVVASRASTSDPDDSKKDEFPTLCASGKKHFSQTLSRFTACGKKNG